MPASVRSFIIVHCEPGLPPDGSHPEAQWGNLAHLVSMAEAQRCNLTIALSPPWGRFALQWPNLRSTLARWIASGHELAYHHHGYGSPPGWDGFSNVPAAAAHPEYRGTAEDGFALVTATLPAAPVRVGAMTGAASDWSEDLTIRAKGGGALSVPTLETVNGCEVLAVTYEPIAGSGSALTPADVRDLIATARDGEVLGLVLHVEHVRASWRSVQAVMYELVGGAGPSERLSEVCDGGG